jgi:hypothetical protein
MNPGTTWVEYPKPDRKMTHSRVKQTLHPILYARRHIFKSHVIHQVLGGIFNEWEVLQPIVGDVLIEMQ